MSYHSEDIFSGLNYELRMSDWFDPNLCEPVSEGRGKLFFTVVSAGVHSGYDAESRLSWDGLPTLSSFDSNLIALQNLIEPLQDTIFGCVNLIYEEDATLKHGLNNNSIDKLKFEVGVRIGGRSEGTQQIWGFHVLVAVDAEERTMGEGSQKLS